MSWDIILAEKTVSSNVASGSTRKKGMLVFQNEQVQVPHLPMLVLLKEDLLVFITALIY